MFTNKKGEIYNTNLDNEIYFNKHLIGCKEDNFYILYPSVQYHIFNKFENKDILINYGLISCFLRGFAVKIKTKNFETFVEFFLFFQNETKLNIDKFNLK